MIAIRRAASGALSFIIATALAGAAFAQDAMPGRATTSGFLNPNRPTAPTTKSAPPPALPGAASRGGAPAPASQLPTDMSPNDALFDAINRGDIASARDALSRGADINARNVLGMTPMELAVDLGRNDISFLLLSYRRPEPAPSAAPKPGADLLTAGANRPGKGGKKAVAQAKAERVTPPAPPQTAKLFARDGGAPNPSVGFLGFDPSVGNP